MIERRYRDAADLERLQAFNAAAWADADGCGYLHPGDIPHRIFNGNRDFAPSEVVMIWEDNAGIVAWSIASPRHREFDAQVRADLRGGSVERAVLERSEQHTVALMHEHEIDPRPLSVEGYQCDVVRVDLLLSLGWSLDPEPPWIVNRAALDDLPEPTLPAGFSIRSARGAEEAAGLAAVHAASFGSSWTPEAYRHVMESPGYEPERELVVEAPDGTLAAFAIIWLDQHNGTGLLEPVGTHHRYRRRGLARAIVLAAMWRLADAGMRFATVVNEGTNEASAALYRGCGFEPWHLVDGYTKSVEP